MSLHRVGPVGPGTGSMRPDRQGTRLRTSRAPGSWSGPGAASRGARTPAPASRPAAGSWPSRARCTGRAAGSRAAPPRIPATDPAGSSRASRPRRRPRAASLTGSRGHSERLPLSESGSVPDTEAFPSPVSTENHWRYWSGPISTTPRHVRVIAIAIADVSARRRQNSIQTTTSASTGLGASASAIPMGMPVRNASDRRASGYRAAARMSVTCPRSRSRTTGAKPSAATATRMRSTVARPRVSSLTPVVRISEPKEGHDRRGHGGRQPCQRPEGEGGQGRVKQATIEPSIGSELRAATECGRVGPEHAGCEDHGKGETGDCVHRGHGDERRSSAPPPPPGRRTLDQVRGRRHAVWFSVSTTSPSWPRTPCPDVQFARQG